MFARLDENPAMTLQDIKETKHFRRTDGWKYGRTTWKQYTHHKQSLRGLGEYNKQIKVILEHVYLFISQGRYLGFLGGPRFRYHTYCYILQKLRPSTLRIWLMSPCYPKKIKMMSKIAAKKLIICCWGSVILSVCSVKSSNIGYIVDIWPCPLKFIQIIKFESIQGHFHE